MVVRVIILIVTLIINCSIVYAAGVAYESEGENAASYSVRHYMETNNLEVTIVKYVSKDTDDEFWMRIWYARTLHKMLPNVRLYVDGDVINLFPIKIKDIDGKHIYSGVSLITDPSAMISHDGARRFYSLTPEIIEKIMNAEIAYLLIDTHDELNRKFNFDEDYKNKMKIAFNYTFNDFSNLWHPKIKRI